MTRPGTIAELRRNDRFQFPGAPETGYQVKEVIDGPDAAGIITLRVSATYGSDLLWSSTFPLPQRAQVVITNRPRLVDIPCRLCGNTETVQCDTATGPLPRVVICGPCDTRITAEVVAEMEHAKTVRYVVEDPRAAGKDRTVAEVDSASEGMAFLHVPPRAGLFELWAFVAHDGSRLRIPHLVARRDQQGAVHTTPRGRHHLATPAV